MKRKLALCVGINDYPGEGNDLSGCVNDARDWAELLDANGYWTTKLLDADATHMVVMTELKRMVEEARWGDRIVFTYSGHGSWIPDASGDEADGRDEVMCMYDFQNGGLLTDDELALVFGGRRAGVRVMTFSDSCFSGSVTRAADLRRSDLVEWGIGPAKVRYMPPSKFLSAKDVTTATRLENAPANKSRPGVVLISGCSDQEYSYDASYNGVPNGAFTRTAIDTFAADQSILNWHRRIRRILPSTMYPQSPQLEASGWQRYWRL